MAQQQTEDKTARTPLVEVNVSYEHGPTPSSRRLSEAVEIVTANHVYVLDAGLRCIAVRGTSSSAPAADSTFIDARLVGGQVNSEAATELSYPFPRPGAVAVFELRRGHARQFRYTSPVQRVVMRLSIVTVTRTNAIPTWEEISRTVHPDE